MFKIIEEEGQIKIKKTQVKKEDKFSLFITAKILHLEDPRKSTRSTVTANENLTMLKDTGKIHNNISKILLKFIQSFICGWGDMHTHVDSKEQIVEIIPLLSLYGIVGSNSDWCT